MMLLGGCAALDGENVADTERLLAAAGFEMRPADTPQRRANLASLTPHMLVAHPVRGSVYYVYADPEDCDCLYVGDEQAYRRYRDLRVQQGIAEQIEEQEEAAAETNGAAGMNWGLWGPWPWWP